MAFVIPNEGELRLINEILDGGLAGKTGPST